MNGTKWPQEIEDKMHVRPFEEPRESEGVMTQAELEAFPEARDRQILLHVSRISILLQHILISHCNLIDQCRQHEATSIQERIKAKKSYQKLFWILVGAIAAALAEKLMHL